METSMNKIFLGGTCADTTWRDNLVDNLNQSIGLFNPFVLDWTEEAQLEEIEEKTNHCNIHLYVITSAMKGVFSIAEVVQSSLMDGKITILQVQPDGFTEGEMMSLKAVVDLVKTNGAISYIDGDLMRTARLLNAAFS